MKNYKLKILLFLGSVSLAIGITAVKAQPWQKRNKVDLGAFIEELVKINILDNQTQSAIWLPFEFYAEANQAQEKNTAQIEKELEPLKPYLIFMVQCSLEKPDSSVIYESAEQLYARAILKEKNGSEIKPLTNIPGQLSARLDAIKSLMSQGSTQSAANMHILVFPFNNPAGNCIVNTQKRDKLTVVLNQSETFKKTVFKWCTPFDALTEDVICPRCSEILSAKWYYCPWCGNKL